MLVEGDIDALAYPRYPTAFQDGNPAVDQLFDDPAAVDRAYYRDTGIFPLMHVVAVADDVIEEHPWVPTSLRKGFAEANRIATREVDRLVESRQSLTWGHQQLLAGEEPYDLLQTERDLWTDDVDRLMEQLTPLIGYAERDGLVEEAVDPRELFAESSLERLPHAV
jgi:4,5-dihydroxyphthalate decarboxylase